MKRIAAFCLILGLTVVLVSGCTRNSQGEQTAEHLVVGMMSAVDAAPFYHARNANLFEEAGIDVELVLFTNGQQRQTALQTGQVDGAMTDLVALITHSTGDFSLRGTLSTDGLFPLLMTHDLPEQGELSVGTMEISVTNYLLDHYFTDAYTLKKVFINEIPARLEAVASGQLDAGIFPEPFASIGVLRDLQRIQFSGIPKESLNIIAFTEAAIAEKPETIERFHQVYAKAVAEIRHDEGLAMEALYSFIPNLPEAARDLIALPRYHDPRLPSESFTREIVYWTEQITHKHYATTASDLYAPQFVRGL